MPKDMKRMNYFNGLLLKEEDLTLDQNYHKRVQRLHNRYFHDWGVVDGLKVTGRDLTKVEIAPGFALNRVTDPENNEEISQEILVSDAHPGRVLDLSGYSTSDQIYISVSYKEELADPDLIKGGGQAIHVLELADIQASSRKPADVSKNILLARVTLTHTQDGALSIDQIYETDVDGSALVTRAVGGTKLKADKIIIGSKEDPEIPFLSNSKDEDGEEGNRLNVHAAQTEFTGNIRAGAISTYGDVDVNGGLSVTSGSEKVFKVNDSGDMEIAGAVTAEGPFSAKSGIEVSGGMAVLDVPQLVIGGSKVTLNQNAAEEDRMGIEILRKDQPGAKLQWDENNQGWMIGTDLKEGDKTSGMFKVAYGADWEQLHHGANADSLHTHSQLNAADGKPVLRTDDQGNILVDRGMSVSGTLVSGKDGLEVFRGATLPNAKIAWNEAAQSWQIGTANGDMTDIPDGKQWEELTGGSHNADSLHTHRQFHNEDKSLLALEIGADGNVNIPHELMVGETLTVNKLIVREEEVVIRKVEQEVADSFLTVNKAEDHTALGSKGGLDVYRGSQNPQARMEWNETDRKWKIGLEGSMSDIPYGTKWDSLTNGSVADTSHKHSTLSTPSGGTILSADGQGKLSASGNLEIGGTLLAKGSADLKADLKVGGSATIEGDLTVKGTTTFVKKEDLVVVSNRIEMNKFEGNSSALKQSSIEVYRGKLNPSAKLLWDETEGRWKLGLGDELSNIAYGSNWDALTGGVSSDADGLHRHNSLSDSEGNTALQTTSDGDIEIINGAEVQGTLTVNNGADISGGLAVQGQVRVDGNLIVKGTTTTVEREDLVVTNNIIEINKFEGDSPPANESGIEVYRGESQPAARMIWSESERKWKIGIGTALENVASGSSWDKLTQMGNADSLHIHSQLYNPQNDVLALSASAEGDVDVHHDLTVGSSLTVAGDLEIRGTFANIATDELDIGSPWITINKDADAVTSLSGGGLEIYRGAGETPAKLSWDENKDQWQLATPTDSAALVVDSSGNVTASGGVKAVSAVISGGLTAASAAIAGTVTVGDGLEVMQGTETSAQIKWAKDRWKLGTAGKTVLSLTRSGKMGVGTDNPTEVLDVAGKAIFRTETEVSGAASFSGKLTAHNEAAFDGDVTFNKGLKAVNAAISNNVSVGGNVVAGGFEAPRGLDSNGEKLPNARIVWNNEQKAWFYGDGDTLAEFGTGKGGQNKLFNSLGNTIAVYSDAQGNVGIGTTTPLALVDVKVSSGDTAFSVTGAGNVGIGTYNPGAKLDVQGNAAVRGDLSAVSAVLSKDLTVNGNLTVNGDIVTINAATLEVEDNIIRVNKYSPQATPVVKNAGLEVFRGGTALPAQLLWDETADEWLAGISNTLKAIEFKGHTHPEFASLSGAITVDAGNVGIGTAAPTAKLDVNGNVAVSGKLTVIDAAVSGTLTAGGASLSGTAALKDVTVSGALTAKDATFSGGLTAKDAAVSGTFTAKDAAVTGSLTLSQGIAVGRGTDPKAQILWDESLDAWLAGTAGSMKQLSYSGHTHQELTELSGVLKVVSGNLGIGTAAPTAKLDVNGNAAVSGQLTVTNATVSGSLTAKDASISGVLTAQNATLSGTAELKDANVSGILTAKNATVSGALTAKEAAVSGTFTAKDAAITGSLILSQGIEVGRGTDAKAQMVWNEGVGEWQAGIAGSLKQLAYSGHTHQELTDLSGVLKVASGNLGIGTAAPTAKLDVNGNAAVSGKLTAVDAALSGALTAKDATLTGALAAKDAALSGTLTAKDAAVTATLSVKDLVLSNKLTAKDAVISGSLVVSQGIEVTRGADKKARILWDNAANVWQAGIEDTMQTLVCKDAVYDQLVQVAGAVTLDSSSNVGIGKTPTDDYKLDVDGNLRATNFAQTSSRTYKENIASLPVKRALELLNKLKPVTFNYKAENAKKQNIGFIAEEVPQIFSTSDHKSVVLMDIIGVLTTVVQKQQKEGQDMRKLVKELQVQVAALAGA
ncbi:tail fiber domain-containing protein [Paenibacillus sp. FSL R5-0912]|uniref:tail fiber domain-containing protein n=1 Tax=Paenibacillus sp. FSL R5-0912 TaxID=1536771 RepID=UPI0006939132|nr:tail fiber domain-containing protein [Paenibacillus sp. FSL R5-0912]